MVLCPLCRRPLQALGEESTFPEPPLPEAPAARPPVITDPWGHFSNPWARPIRVRALAPRGSRRDLRGARDLWDPHASGSSAASDSRAPHFSAPSADSTTPQSGYVVLRNGSRESQLGIHWRSWGGGAGSSSGLWLALASSDRARCAVAAHSQRRRGEAVVGQLRPPGITASPLLNTSSAKRGRCSVCLAALLGFGTMGNYISSHLYTYIYV